MIQKGAKAPYKGRKRRKKEKKMEYFIMSLLLKRSS
jgi:hypothetical protein